MKIRRRQFLQIAATASITACSSDSETDAGPGPDASADVGADSATGGDAGTDLGADTFTDAADDTLSDTSDGSAEAPDASQPESAMSGPFWMHLAGDRALVRFVLKGETGASVQYGADDSQTATMRSVTDEVDFEWPPPAFSALHPDVPGIYTLHEAEIPLAGASEPVPFTIVEEGGARTTGACPVPPSGDRPFRVVWVADTMTGQFEEVARVIAEQQPDLVIHGGDIQYQSNPLDTWLGFFENLRPVLQTTYTQFIIGNHEYDDYPSGADEFESQYRRFFDQQTGPGTGVHYHELRTGPIAWLLLNSEEDFDDVNSEQWAWARQRLQAAGEDADIKQIVVGFHRPYYTFGERGPRRATRDAVHPILRDAGVALVLNGHEHSYQRFNVDGMVYAVDGGGGALSYSTDEGLPDIEANFPDEVALRQVASRTYGVTVLDIETDGTINARRVAVDRTETDSFTVSPA